MSDAIFLPKVIKYDRYQPEFYEDTFTYIKKRSSKNAIIFPEVFLYAKDFRPVRGTTLSKGAVSEG